MFHITKNIPNDSLINHQNLTTPVFDRAFQIISGLIVFFNFLSLGFLIFVSQRGFNITDEGYHLLASQFPTEVEIWTNVAHYYTAIMFNLVNLNIVNLRILGEILMMASASISYFGLLQLVLVIYPGVKIDRSVRIIAWSMISLGALFYYIHFAATPSYNALNAILLNAATGFFCFCLAGMSVSHAKRILAIIINSFIVGLLIGILLLVRFPTAITLTLLFSFIIIIWPQIKLINRLISISMMVLGTVTWILLHITFIQPWAILWHTLYGGINFFLAFGLHKPIFCIQHYITETISLIFNALINFWKIYLVLFLSIIAWYRNFNKQKISRTLLGIYIIILLILTGLNSIALNFYKGGVTNSVSLMEVYTSWLLLLLFLTTFTIYQEKFYKKNVAEKRLLVLSGLLLILPFAGAIGTANVITHNLTLYMAGWFGLMLILLSLLAFFYQNRWILFIGSFIISAFACSQIISSGYVSPYNLNTTIQYQRVPTAIGFPITYLTLDKDTHEFFYQINQIAKSHGLKPGDDILAFSNMPGIVFALGGKSPIIPWYPILPHAKIINEQVLRLAPSQRIKHAFILQNASGTESMPDLTKLGIRFPSDYIFCGQLIWPITGEWVRLYKPKFN